MFAKTILWELLYKILRLGTHYIIAARMGRNKNVYGQCIFGVLYYKKEKSIYSALSKILQMRLKPETTYLPIWGFTM